MSPLGERLFSFAVIADTHVNQEEGKASSDFAVNRLANARNRAVMHAVNRAKPEFVLHLGDIVHPTPGHPAYGDAARVFHELAGLLDSPLHLTPGNHDVGDKPGDWLPVPSVNDAYLALYAQHFGANYHAFDAHGCHFVVIDAQVVNSGLASEAAQRAWLEADLEASRGKRIFLCTHYPLYVLEPGEGSHYDNIDEPGRSWLLGLIERHGVEAVFAGHVHNFWYHLQGDTRMYLLPSTAFVRLDYSEMYRIEPGLERGRNDAAKLGFLVVDVHQHGHVAHPVRSHGTCLAPGEQAASTETLPPVHPRTLERSPLGIDLRHAWAEVTDVAASGAMDEFSRKPVRNDYPLMALWEMGIRRLRVPVADLIDARVRERMRVLQLSGHAFTVHSHGFTPAMGELIAQHAALIGAWEVVAPLAGLERVAAGIAQARAGQRFPVRLSKLRRPGDAQHHGEKARHVIEHGFEVAEAALAAGLFAQHAAVRAAFDGVVFRVPRGRDAWDEIAAVDRLGPGHEVMVRLAADNPAVAHDDDLENANRVASALFAAHATPGVGVWIDTFADVDRGYFPRAGLVDRRYNPRLAGAACRNLNSALANARLDGAVCSAAAYDGGRALTIEASGRRHVLLLPQRAMSWSAIPEVVPSAGAGGAARWVALASGAVHRVRWTGDRRLGAAIDGDGPVLLELE